MPIYREEAERLMGKLQNELVMQIDQHSQFISALWDEDDWSFVIKSHALIEASATQMLAQHSGNEGFTSIFERLPLCDEEIGKLAAIKALNLLGKRERRFIRTYSTLRNSMVHRVENIGFSFEKSKPGHKQNSLQHNCAP